MFSLPLLFLPAVLVSAHRFPSHSRLRSRSCHVNDSSSSGLAAPVPVPSNDSSTSGCFPSLGFEMPSDVPNSAEGWWCDPATEYAFVGFSYEVTSCACVILNKSSCTHGFILSAGQSLQKLNKDFADIRNRFHSRYVRLYGACDRDGFYDDVIEAAWDNTLGVHALIWVSLPARYTPTSSLFETQFGFDGTDQWMGRRDNLFSTLHSNPKAQFVTRVVQFGSEPLFDGVLPSDTLAAQVLSAKNNLSSLGIPVTVSELAYGYQENGGAQNVLDVIDSINIHMLPFFSSDATTGKVSLHPLIYHHSAIHRR
jgi:hypothetical protein